MLEMFRQNWCSPMSVRLLYTLRSGDEFKETDAEGVETEWVQAYRFATSL